MLVTGAAVVQRLIPHMYLVLIVVLLSSPFAYLMWSRRRDLELMRRQGRYVDWSALLVRLDAGEGTIILNRTNVPHPVWWTPSTISPQDSIRALLTDAIVTNCPRRMRTLEILKSTFPKVAVVEARGTIRRKQAS